MDAFADSKYYSETYLSGKEAVIDTASFAFYARKATQEIRRYTGQNVDESNPPECVKMCCCEVAELLYSANQTAATHATGVTSESVGSWSVNYGTAEQNAKTLRGNIRSAVYRWLTGTGLLYLGVERCSAKR